MYTTTYLGYWRAFTLIQSHLHKLDVEVASWHHQSSMKIRKEYHLLLACSAYKIIRDKHDDLLGRQKCHSQISIKKGEHRCVHYFQSFYQSSKPLS